MFQSRWNNSQHSVDLRPHRCCFYCWCCCFHNKRPSWHEGIETSICYWATLARTSSARSRLSSIRCVCHRLVGYSSRLALGRRVTRRPLELPLPSADVASRLSRAQDRCSLLPLLLRRNRCVRSMGRWILGRLALFL